jgi:hypothetical protein
MRGDRFRVVLSLALAVMTIAVLVACSKSRLTKENYDRIAAGMSPAEVQAILGPGTEQASSSVAIPGGTVAGVNVPGANTSAKVFTWHEGQKVISVTFVNDKMTTKTQFGL